MNRRDFLRSALLATVAVDLAPYAAIVPTTKGIGVCIPLSRQFFEGERWIAEIETVIDRSLAVNAARRLPPGTRYEVRLGSPTDFGRVIGLAWYHHPAMIDDPDWDKAECGWFIREGESYALIERRTT